MTYLKVLRLDANPLHCDCSLKWLYTFSKAKRVPVQFAAVCQTPSNLYGRAFASLQATDFKCCKCGRLREEFPIHCSGITKWSPEEIVLPLLVPPLLLLLQLLLVLFLNPP